MNEVPTWLNEGVQGLGAGLSCCIVCFYPPNVDRQWEQGKLCPGRGGVLTCTGLMSD